MSATKHWANFELLEQIGSGGMGTVYRARDRSLGREVAVKILRDDRLDDPALKTSFLKEAQASAALSHPNILQVYSVGEEADGCYLVMELLRGQSLQRLMDQEGALPEARVLQVAIDVAQGLRAAARHQLVHGDIKPDNIFLTGDDTAKILDFGLTKLALMDVETEAKIVGSPAYCSPERVEGRPEDFQSDMYSLGVTLFEALTGQLPFQADEPLALARERLHRLPPRVRDVNPAVSPGLDQVIARLLTRQPTMRYATYGQLLTDLWAVRDRSGLEATERAVTDQSSGPDPAAPVSADSAWGVWAWVAVLVAILAGLVAWQTGSVERGRWSRPRIAVPFTYWTDETPGNVSIVGDFNDWDPAATPLRRQDDGTWTTRLELAPGEHSYKLVVDGDWRLDPVNPQVIRDAAGGQWSLLVVEPAAEE